MNQKEADQLIAKYLNNTATPEERVLIEAWYAHESGKRKLSDDDGFEQLAAELWAATQQRAGLNIKTKTIKLWPRIAAAAAVLAFLSFGLYQFLHKNSTTKPEYANDIAPGSGKPYLTLANGQKIVVGNTNGIIAKQGRVTIQQNINGLVSYNSGKAVITDAPYNTLTNPPGGKVISLILPDGTLAKLDAASSITYQTAFAGPSRKVSTTGRVYFAVIYNKNQPFFTSTKGQIIKDLGTHFIVDGYNDEATVKTTLVEGSVTVSSNNKKVLLSPGQQSLLQSSSNIITVKEAHLDEETAWLNGDFDFNNQNLDNIMRQLARVYNIEVTYKDNLENLRFSGMLSRSHNISAVLNLMESTGKIHFEVNGRRVLVIEGKK